MDTVVGVKEFQVAAALLDGQQELLGQQVHSQWGPVHLFELCLTFGLFDTAWAMAEKGVRGCRLEAYHLKRNVASTVERWTSWSLDCQCKAWQVCDLCCFGFPVNEGVWMKDWDASLMDAADAARESAKKPLLRATLDAFRSGDGAPSFAPFAISEDALVHLLDIAILTGDQTVAMRCAEQSKLRPLRRWRSHDVFEFSTRRWLPLTDEVSFYGWSYELRAPHILTAALAVGGTFDGLWLSVGEAMPFREALTLCGALPGRPHRTSWAPEGRNNLGSLFLTPLGAKRIEHAQAANIPLDHFGVRCLIEDPLCGRSSPCLSFIDLAILLGRPDLAELATSQAPMLSQEGCRAIERWARPSPERWALVAIRALTLSWRREVTKAVAVYQAMKQYGGFCPVFLVDEVVVFSMSTDIMDQLNLWEAVKMTGWAHLGRRANLLSHSAK